MMEEFQSRCYVLCKSRCISVILIIFQPVFLKTKSYVLIPSSLTHNKAQQYFLSTTSALVLFMQFPSQWETFQQK